MNKQQILNKFTAKVGLHIPGHIDYWYLRDCVAQVYDIHVTPHISDNFHSKGITHPRDAYIINVAIDLYMNCYWYQDEEIST